MYDNYTSCYLSELVGTFILCLGVASGTFYEPDGTQRTNYILTLSVIFTSIIINARIGGGDFNPSVTLTKYFCYENKQKFHIDNVIANYCICQCLGALLSFLFYAYASNYTIVYKLRVSPHNTLFEGFVMEFVSSFFTYFFIILVDQNKTLTNYPLKMFCCMAAVAMGMSIGGATSGAGLNPAVGFGSSLARLFINGNIKEIDQLWIFVLAPIFASYCASKAFKSIKENYYI